MSVTPVATYRLQLTPEFGFAAVIDVLDHIQRLGASHVYLSPIAEAVPGSTHGYDVVDHTSVRREFGGAPGFEQLLDRLASRGMAALIDHVPNHVSSARPDANPNWWSLLRDGPGSAAADWFDVDWDLTGGKVILPVLGSPLDQAIRSGHVVVDGDVVVVHGERRLPLAPGGPSTDDLAAVLESQHYRLQFWRDTARNVRRFFTIDDLVAVRVEQDHVAAEVDSLPARFAGHRGFGGVRVDHVDGLADPVGYLTGLRRRIGDDALLYVEKIVAPGETLPNDWPVDGTTGYEFIRAVDQLMIDGAAESRFTERWVADSGDDRSFHEFEAEARVEVVELALRPDFERVERVALAAIDVADQDRANVSSELRRLTTELPRYRTYLPADPDAARLVSAICSGPVADAILNPADDGQRELRTRWQQLTGPVMAKGAEDRSFYRYLRLASLCEVGGDPATFGNGVDEFHRDNAHRQQSWPLAMLAASTHDTKRSGDVRARSAALTWLADQWLPLHAEQTNDLIEVTGVDRVTASLAVQTVACVRGLDGDRLREYLVKSSREAAVHTTWEDPDRAFEDRVAVVAERAVADRAADVPIARVAPGISLVVTALRLTSPGVPDIYQGTDTFSFRLVDPDNRVLPDWDRLAELSADDRTVAELWAANEPGVKTALVRAVLALRRRVPDAFGPAGEYRPVPTGEGVVAFLRGDDVLVFGRRGTATVTESVKLPAGTWYDVLDPEAPGLHGRVDVASLVGSGGELSLPIAVLERDR